MILLVFITLFTSSTQAQVEVTFDSISCERQSLMDITCKERNGWRTLLQASSLTFATVSYICGVTPEPAATKAVAAISKGASLFLGYVSLMVTNLPCTQSQKYELEGEDKEQFIQAVCDATNKVYDPITNSCI